MKVKTKNNRSLVAILVILLLALVGTTIAYHTSKGNFANIFRTIFDQWTVTEEFVSPTSWQACQRVPKKIYATNTGNAPVGVRIKLEEYWKRNGSTSTTHETELPLQVNGQNVAVVNLNTDHDWEYRDDGYYYYTRPLESYSSTSTFMDYVEYNCNINVITENDECETVNGRTSCTKDQYDYDNAQYHLYATVEITDEPASYNVSKPRVATITRGANLNYRIKSIANPGQSFANTGVVDTKVRAIKKADALPADFVPTSMNRLNYYSNQDDIRGWFEESTGTFYIYTEADYIETPTDMGWTFQEFDSLTDISGVADWHTSKTTEMNSFFSGCNSLTNVDALAKWDVSNVTTLGWFLYQVPNLTNVNGLANWHIGNVTTLQSIFYEDFALSDISGIKDWDTSSVTHMGWLLYGVQGITNIDALRYWDTSNVTAINSAFNGCTSLTNITGVENWNTINVTNMGWLFYAVPVRNLNALSTWRTDNVQYLDNAFNGMSSLNDISGLKNWNTGNVTTIDSIFYNATALGDLSPLANWNTGNIQNMAWAFGVGGEGRNPNIKSLSPLARWDVRKVTSLNCTFYGLTGVTSLDGLQNWQTNSLQDLSWTFANIGYRLTDISQIAGWNLSSVTTIFRLFSGDSNVNGSSLNGWSVPSGADTSYAFTGSDKPTWFQG